ncbi:hypothetical protein NDU88_000014 [Pleurodeles waltl]|uniref:Uncharacterized protein n=1 Tax=Pleurodeles waltl TaxID=8319 RepID=A0AAV7S4F4_PLEWA|nr:hypothetical protein NDU88_000014 [Pleurodeles waltl]
MSSAIRGVRSGPPVTGDREELDLLRGELLSLRVTLAAPGAVIAAYNVLTEGLRGLFLLLRVPLPPLRPDAVTLFTRASSNFTTSQSSLLQRWAPLGRQAQKSLRPTPSVSPAPLPSLRPDAVAVFTRADE